MKPCPNSRSSRRKKALTSLTPHASRITGEQSLVTSPATGAGRFRVPSSAFLAAPKHSEGGRASSAFSLVEILVVIGLLSVIILGLLMMFTQTQRAFRAGMAQVDVLEAGRAATEMISRELSQITPANYNSNTVTFYAEISPFVMEQPLPGTNTVKRQNVVEQMFFLTRENKDGQPCWNGIGYWVGDPNTGDPVPAATGGWGTLYRFQTNTVFGVSPSPTSLYGSYDRFAVRQQRMSRIIDGVVHFKVRLYDTNGVWITSNLRRNTEIRDIRLSSTIPGEVELYRFTNNAVPASVEFELGVLEDRALARVRSIPDATARRQYLENQAGRVHLFRMRVPIRNVDPLAYQ